MTGNKQIDALGSAIAMKRCEGTERYQGDKRAYQVLLGGSTFSDMSVHPAEKGWKGIKNSRAAGKYQMQPATWRKWKEPNTIFDERGQDLAFINGLKRLGVYEKIMNGYIDDKVLKLLATQWTSLPHGKENPDKVSKAEFLKKFVEFGGGYFDENNNFHGNIEIKANQKKKLSGGVSS